MKASQILSMLLSALVKIAIAIWIVNFVYTKATGAYDFGYRIFTEEAIAPAPGKDVPVAITEGKSNMDIAKLLVEKGLTREKYLTFVQILASEHRKDIKPGAYVLNTSMTTEEMLGVMSPEETYEADE